jgi:hydrogenase maturation protein HypF
MKARSFQVRGIVQGVGFRPHVCRMAVLLGLAGHVKNTGRGVEILIEGEDDAVEKFTRKLRDDPPPMALIEEIVFEDATLSGLHGFRVLSSKSTEVETLPPPDLAICPDCAAELIDRSNRRFGYPLINCMNCGPRFSIIRSLPYDRKRTTMGKFRLCRLCESEYRNPLDRRFRAEPISCPTCGPKLWYMSGGHLLRTEDPIVKAAHDIDHGKVVAVKGIGGFHLAADATNEDTIRRLRNLKQRHSKPFALMARDITSVDKIAFADEAEKRWLASPASPIVLLKKRLPERLAPSVAPSLDTLGVMLPYSGIHLMLLHRTKSPYLVMTSGNPKDEAIAYQNEAAMERLSGMTDSFLMHSRDILNFEDDSVIRVVDREPVMTRRSRGFAPVPIKAPRNVDGILGVGADLKNTFAMGRKDRVFISQHVGDLDSMHSLSAVKPAIARLSRLIGGKVKRVSHDMHPGYRSTELAESIKAERVPVQHHHAHLVSSAASNGIVDETLGLACDGTGYGTDGQVWGFEMMLFDPNRFERIGRLLPFSLPGSDSAVMDPRRVALSLLIQALGDEAMRVDVGLGHEEAAFIAQMMASKINTPTASSCGRLFDAVSAILGVCRSTTYEGQPAIELEAVSKRDEEGHYPYELSFSDMLNLDHRPMLRAIVEDIKSGRPKETVAGRFHNTLVRAMAEMIRIGSEKSGYKRVVLGGGSFCNSLLVGKLKAAMKEGGYQLIMPKLLPPNDGGISYGQVVVAAGVK